MSDARLNGFAHSSIVTPPARAVIDAFDSGNSICKGKQTGINDNPDGPQLGRGLDQAKVRSAQRLQRSLESAKLSQTGTIKLGMTDLKAKR